MTQLDVLYRFGAPPTESAAMAIANLREVYGFRKVDFKEKEKTVRVEYDASRLTGALVQQLLRRAGLDIVEEVSLIPPQLPLPGSPATTPPPAS